MATISRGATATATTKPEAANPLADIDVYALPVHPAATAFRLMSEDELAEHVADIKRNGQQRPITVCDIGGVWTLIDGRNTREACKRLGIARPRVEPVGTDQIAEFVWSANGVRRHDSVGQTAMAYATLFPIAEQHGGRRTKGAKQVTPHNLLGKDLSMARRVLAWGEGLADRVRDGELSLEAAYRQVLGATTIISGACGATAKPPPPPEPTPAPEPPQQPSAAAQPEPEPQPKPEPDATTAAQYVPLVGASLTFSEAERLYDAKREVLAAIGGHGLRRKRPKFDVVQRTWLDAIFRDVVIAKLSEVVNGHLGDEMQAERARIEKARRELDDARNEVEAAVEKLREQASNTVQLMTEEEFVLVRNAVHPDRPERTPEKLTRAFQIMQRLGDRADGYRKQVDVRVMRHFGWCLKKPKAGST